MSKIKFSSVAGHVDCSVCGRTVEVYDWRRCERAPCPRLVRSGPNVVLKTPRIKQHHTDK